MLQDHYEVLGVATHARHIEIRSAYREQMRRHHPDVRPGDPSAEEMTRRVTAAWSVLGKPSTRAAYDRTRAATRPSVAALRDQTRSAPAYSPVGTAYRRALHVASLRIATVVFVVGVFLLLAMTR